ncbi:unnamed protein product [Ixodes persulcatus]
MGRKQKTFAMKTHLALLLLLCLAESVIAQDAAPNTALQVTAESSSPDDFSSSGPQKVNVTVLYESYCKDSSSFITKQLWPVYKQLKNQMIVDLVPYGRSKTKESSSGGPATFVCRHGAAECLANIVHSCAIALYPNTALHLNFIACTMKTWKPERAVRKCTRDGPMDSQKIQGCVSSSQGKNLFQKMGARTAALKPPITTVPSVVIDGTFNKKNQKKIQKDLKAAVCRHFKPPVPEACQKKKRGLFRKR